MSKSNKIIVRQVPVDAPHAFNDFEFESKKAADQFITRAKQNMPGFHYCFPELKGKNKND